MLQKVVKHAEGGRRFKRLRLGEADQRRLYGKSRILKVEADDGFDSVDV